MHVCTARAYDKKAAQIHGESATQLSEIVITCVWRARMTRRRRTQFNGESAILIACCNTHICVYIDPIHICVYVCMYTSMYVYAECAARAYDI